MRRCVRRRFWVMRASVRPQVGDGSGEFGTGLDFLLGDFGAFGYGKGTELHSKRSFPDDFSYFRCLLMTSREETC